MSEDDLKNVAVEIGKIDYLQVKQKGLENGSIAGTVNNYHFDYCINCYFNCCSDYLFNCYVNYYLLLHIIL